MGSGAGAIARDRGTVGGKGDLEVPVGTFCEEGVKSVDAASVGSMMRFKSSSGGCA